MPTPVVPGIPYISESELDIDENEIGKGADANVYQGEWCMNDKSPCIKVAIKRARIRAFGGATKALVQKKRLKLVRELGIWTSLQNASIHPHILPLLGVLEVPNGLLASVSEYCIGTLAAYLRDYESRPQRIDLMIGTLKGLTHMHELSVVHGDLKSVNVLVTEQGTAKICDFGHSRIVNDGYQDQYSNSDASSNFQATMRYTCPEYFRTNKAKPTVFSDMWAFGCLALEILSQLQPYHTIQSEFLVSIAIRSGVVPSVKPEYPNAAGCLNDILWNTVKRCWYAIPTQRPTSSVLLKSVYELVARGLVNPSAATPQRPALLMDDELVELPEGVKDYATKSKDFRKELISSQKTVNIWAYYGDKGKRSATSGQRSPIYVVKTPYVASSLDSSYLAHGVFGNALRQVTRDRYGWQHRNIVKLLGIDTSFGKHYGIVMEYGSQGSFISYKNKMRQEEELYVTYMTHILNGLQHLHTMISPLSHGDLTPANIIVDGDGNLKLTTFSFGRLLLDLPNDVRRVLFEDETPSARHLSPELLQDAALPTPKSDMWAFGNLAFWIFTNLAPYPDFREEIEIVAQLTRGAPPNGLSQLDRLEELGGTRLLGDPHWLSNGIWNSILRCWDADPGQRLSATGFLRMLENRPMSVRGSDHRQYWDVDGVIDLAGRIKKSSTHRYGVGLGWSIGVWRGTYDGRGNRTTCITLLSWKTELSQGFFLAKCGVYQTRGATFEKDQHPNVCELLGIDQTSVETTGIPSIILEYCSNRTLQEYYNRGFVELGRKGKVALLRGLGNALNYVHHEIPQGVIVHGNLSFDTILIDAKGTLKLSNFEFSCQYAHADNTLEAVVIQAPPLTPTPSRWHGPDFFEGPTDAGWPNPTQFTDLWALGSLTVAIWINKVPYADFETPGALSQIMDGAWPFDQTDCASEIWGVATQLWKSPCYDRISTTQYLELVDAL